MNTNIIRFKIKDILEINNLYIINMYVFQNNAPGKIKETTKFLHIKCFLQYSSDIENSYKKEIKELVETKYIHEIIKY